MHTPTRLFFSALLSILLPVINSCSEKATTEDKIDITVSIEPQRYIVEKIGGDRINASSLLGNNANPETYEPTMSDLAKVEKSAAFLRMGHMAMEDAILARMPSTESKTYDLSKGIDLISGTHSAHCEAHGHSHAHDEDIDPHTWNSVKNARTIALNTLDALQKIDPAGKDYYKANYDNFCLHLDSLDNEIKDILASGGAKSFLVWHPSLSYFARDYSLSQIALGYENKELSTADVRRKIRQAREAAPKSFLMQKDYDSRQAETVNKEIGAKIIYINPLNYNWEEEMISTAKAISGVE